MSVVPAAAVFANLLRLCALAFLVIFGLGNLIAAFHKLTFLLTADVEALSICQELTHMDCNPAGWWLHALLGTTSIIATIYMTQNLVRARKIRFVASP